MERKHFLYVLATTTLSLLLFPLLLLRKLTPAVPQDSLPLKPQKDPRAIGQKPHAPYTCHHCYTPHA